MEAIMDRRDFLGATAAATVAGVAGMTTGSIAQAATGPKPSKGSVHIDTGPVLSGLGKKIPVNRERATQIMAEHGIDGLIALRPHNVYYLANTTTIMTPFGAEYPAFATLPRDLGQPGFLIETTAETWDSVNGDREVPEIIAMSGPRNWKDYIDPTADKMRIEPEAGSKYFKYGVEADADYTKREAAWKKAQEVYNQAAAPSPAWAIVHALKQSGLTKGRIAVDDMRIAYLLQSIGFDSVTIVPGDNLFRKIRHIKSDYEVSMMRVAQRINQESAMAALRTLEEGMTYAEFKQRFFTEATARGGDPSFVLLGVTLGGLPDGVAKRGKSYLIDCCVKFMNYQGDFARTVSIGEPSAEAMRRFKAQQIGREAAFEIIKEGVPFRQLEQTAREAMIKAGMPSDILVAGLHSVGLQHGDDPTRFDTPYDIRDDLVLAENMVVTLDLPYIAIGWGAGHNEDLLRITKNGYEILNDPGDPLVVV
jgi:Xaa-Pro aminopeptidase